MILQYLMLISISTNVGFGLNVLNGLNTGILYQYEWSTQIQLTDGDDRKPVDEKEASAIISAQLLHFDRDSDKRVLVIWADNCVNTNCPQSKQGETHTPLKLFSIWHGSKILKLLSPSGQPLQKWDILQSVLFQFQYQLESVKLRPAGLCDSHYSEMNPITRRLTYCKVAEQDCLISKAFDLKSNFTQTSQYFLDASSKLRQLSIREHYELWSPLLPDVRSDLVSISKLQLIDHSDPAGTGQESVDFNAYVEVLKKEQGLEYVADSIEQQFVIGTTAQIPSASLPKDDKCGHFGGMKTLKKLLSSKSSTSLKAFIQLVKYFKTADQSKLLDCLNLVHQSDDSLIGPLIESLAVAGLGDSQETVLRFLDALPRNSQWLRTTYLLMVTHNLRPTNVAKKLLERFEKSTSSTDPDEYLALAVGTLVKRTGDAALQDRMLKTVGQMLSNCKAVKCLEVNLRSLRNLAHRDTAVYVKNFLCHSSALVAREALESLRSVDASHWTNETLQDLARVYADECPGGKSDPSCRTTAAEMLLKVRPDRRWAVDIGSPLLRPLSANDNWQKKREREVFAFSLAKMFDAAAINDEYRKVVTESVGSVLNNNYNRLAHGGLSAVHSGIVGDFSFGRVTYQVNMEFGGEIPKRSYVDIMLEDKNGAVSPLLSFSLFSRGLEAVLGDGGSPDESKKDEEATAGLRLALFDQLQPPLTLFTGQSELLKAVWAASGDPMTAFEGRFVLSDLRGAMPLASGHLAIVDGTTALWWKLTGAIEISLWYRSAHSTIASQTAVLMKGHVTIQAPGDTGMNNLLVEESTLAADLAVDFETDIDFSQNPFRLCLQMNQQPLEIRRQKKVNSSSHKKQIWKREKVRRLPGRCFVTEPKIIQQCKSLLNDLGRA